MCLYDEKPKRGVTNQEVAPAVLFRQEALKLWFYLLKFRFIEIKVKTIRQVIISTFPIDKFTCLFFRKSLADYTYELNEKV